MARTLLNKITHSVLGENKTKVLAGLFYHTRL